MTFPVQDLVGPAKRVGRIGLLLSGLSVILLAVGAYVVVGYDASQGVYNGAQSWVFESLAVAAIGFFFLLLVGVFVLRIGVDVGSGVIPRRGVLLLTALMFSLFLIFMGVAFLVQYSAVPSVEQSYFTAVRNAGIGSLVSGILLILGFLTYVRQSIMAKIIGVIFGIVAVALLLDLSTTYLSAIGENPGYIGLGYFNGVTAAVAPADLGGLTGTLGIAGYIIAGAAAMIYIFVRGSKYVEVSYVIAAVGFIVFAVGVVISTLGFLTGSIWGDSGTTLAVASVNIVYSILFAVAGFLMMAASAMGLAFFSSQMVPLVPQVPGVPQPVGPTTAATQPTGGFCPKCGTRTSPDDAFCKSCGAKLK